MTALPPAEPLPPADAATVAEETPVTLKSLQLRGLFVTLPLVSVGLSIFWASTSSIFVAVQLRAITPSDYTGSLALVVGISAIVSMVAAPLIGAFSDRTRTRLGSRIPWMLTGSLLTVGIAVGISFASSVGLLVVLFSASQLTTQMVSATLSPNIPERVPTARRGAFSAVFGLAALVGSVIGQAIGAGFADSIRVGYLVVSALLMLLVIAFTAFSRTRQDNRMIERTPYDWKALLRTYWVNPVRHPDFAWAFAARFLLFTGYFLASAYQLYILEDYIGLGGGAVRVVPLVGLGTLVGVLVATPFAGALTDRVQHKKRLIYAACGLMAVGLLVPTIVPTVGGMVVSAFIAGVGFGAYNAVDYVIVTEVLPNADDYGKDLGIINVTTSLPQTIAVAVASLIVACLGGYASIFIVAAVFAVLGAALLVPVRSVR